ncbi:MAG TPA: pilin [Candidatus Saccharimonadales bacterium]|jgi:hypothetical protein
MITKLKKLTLIVAAALALSVPALVSSTGYAADPVPAVDVQSGLNCGADFNLNATTGCADPTTASGNGLTNLVRRIVNIFSVIVGVIAVIMIIIGGLKYITSGGESSNVSGAKNTIIYAIVGLIVVALAQFIVRFVLTNTTGLTTG